jgi:hypothetical protein
MRRFGLPLLLVMAWPGAFAETITFRATGTVNEFSGDPAPLAEWIGYAPQLGDPYEAVFSFDSQAPDEDPDSAEVGIYAMTGGLLVTLGPVTIPFDAGSIAIFDDLYFPDALEYEDRYWAVSSRDAFGPCPCDDTFTSLGTSIFLAVRSPGTGGPIASDALPLVPPDPADFEFARMSLVVCPDGGTCVGARAAIENFAVVPVPAVGWLLAPVMGALGWIGRVRSSRLPPRPA